MEDIFGNWGRKMSERLGVAGVDDIGCHGGLVPFTRWGERFEKPPQAAPIRRAVLFFTHVWDEWIEARFLKLSREMGAGYDVWVTGFIPEGAGVAVPGPARTAFAGEAELRAAFTPAPCVCQAAYELKFHHLVPLHFYRRNPGYAHYWVIEFDVQYTGNWADFFAELESSPADLLGTAVQKRQEHTEWFHWSYLCTGGGDLDEAAYVKAFLPVMRVSKRGFEAIEHAYRRNWHGHYEALWPTAIVDAGLLVEDIGGPGAFAPPARRNRHYTATLNDVCGAPGTFCYRPVKTEAEVEQVPAMLWHPVKPEALVNW
jgi:hypothetical protein